MGSVSYAQAIKPDTAKIRKLIENSLLCDWVVRIEYEGSAFESACWQQWGQTFFALRSADAVIAAIKECYSRHSNRVIRIHAEKVRPRTSMLYMLYNPHMMPALMASEAEQAVAYSLAHRDTPAQQPGLRS